MFLWILRVRLPRSSALERHRFRLGRRTEWNGIETSINAFRKRDGGDDDDDDGCNGSFNRISMIIQHNTIQYNAPLLTRSDNNLK